ncbi:putative coat protein YlbD-like [Bacillus oleivorans]|uniref:Putative coat protein YlbD-like n=1 Tax=Bacillus oleivorans TaxID=1448271 RepID=A0A285D0Y1_9BACI|nr:YlbD family protein [Bacillus oleivorans]SNX73335.1 putative coat protein YlbD-like [Bacillus oleivorans]
MEKKLHPSIQQFKEFVNKNPNLVKEVRDGTTTWQELYEEWYLLGEDDSRWDSYKSDEVKNSNEKKEFNSDILSIVWNGVKKMDTEQIQHHLSSLSEAIGAIQGILSQFQANGRNKQKQNQSQNQPSNPFSFRKD